MKIYCGNCGKSVLVPDDIVVGQHVRCPYCNEKTAFDKPSRVELPEGFEVKRKARIKIEELKRAHAEETVPVTEYRVEAKRKLGVIRPAGQASGPDLNAEAIKRRMEADEQDKRVAHEKAAIAQSSVRREKIIRWVIGIALLALLAGTVVCWVSLRSREGVRKRIDALQRREQREQEEERKHKAWLEEQEKHRAEQEAKRAVEREAHEKARESAAKAYAAKVSAQARLEAERLQNVETYKNAAQAFRKGKFCMADSRKILDALAACEDVFFFCFAMEGEDLPIYVSSDSNGVRRVVKMNECGAAADEDFGVFTNRLDKADYLMAHGSQTCFSAVRPHPMTGRLDGKGAINPACVFFGKMYATVKTLALACDNLIFDIVFVPKQKQAKKEIFVQTVEFGYECPMSAVKAAVIEAFPMPEDKGQMKAKKFKRSVVYWNGNMIKQGLDGITYIPRVDNMRRKTGDAWFADRNRWQELCTQAEREEEAERQYYEEARRRFEEKSALANDKVRTKWLKTIDGMLDNGIIGYRARISAGENQPIQTSKKP